MAPDDKSVSNQVASLRVIIVQDPPCPGSTQTRSRESGPTAGTEQDREYPKYKVRVFGPGLPVGAGTGNGQATMIGPHTCMMNVPQAGRYQVTLVHNDHETDPNPDLIVNISFVP
jgi:hypothetical protein